MLGGIYTQHIGGFGHGPALFVKRQEYTQPLSITNVTSQKAFEAVGLTIAAMIFTEFALGLPLGTGNNPDKGDGVLAVNAESREAIDLVAK